VALGDDAGHRRGDVPCERPAPELAAAPSAALYAASAWSSAAWLMNFCACRFFVRSIRGAGLRQRGLGCGIRAGGLARIDAHQQLALLHALAGIGAHFQHAARHLGGHRGLAHGFDRGFDRESQIDLTRLHHDAGRRYRPWPGSAAKKNSPARPARKARAERRRVPLQGRRWVRS
jgi:hypothetical protein